MTGAIGPIIAGAAAKKHKVSEEEKMTTYNSNDLEGWEFKIVRSSFGKFRSQKAVQKVCEEEARAGWQMLEKFDDSRIRFKRRVEKRSMDPHIEGDAYRTSTDAAASSRFQIVIGILLLCVGLAGLALIFYR
ncbi:MAG: hypothetical protein OEW00_02545 [candidate division Zixibacteria bacterium]|nr:hypothetical protein [candidate division Zixibacteria bacterium]